MPSATVLSRSVLAGVTGWVGASRESYLVPREPASDPHFLPYPGIGEEQYGAIFSVPVVTASDDLVEELRTVLTSAGLLEGTPSA